MPRVGSQFRARLGVTIIEAIISLSILFSCILLVIGLLHTASRYESQAKRLTIAVLLSQNAVAEAQDWARDPANFDSDWSGLGRTYSEAEWPGFEVELDVLTPSSDHPSNLLYSPCKTVEEAGGRPPARQRRLGRSMATLRTRCRWGSGSDNVFTLLTNIGEPDLVPRVPNPFQTRRTGASDPVPASDTVEFEVEFVDDGGATIPDVAFDWQSRAHSRPGIGPGAGTLTVLDRYGKRAALRNIYLRNPSRPDVPPDNPQRWPTDCFRRRNCQRW